MWGVGCGCGGVGCGGVWGVECGGGVWGVCVCGGGGSGGGETEDCTFENSVRPLTEVVQNLISFRTLPDTQRLQTLWKSNLNRTRFVYRGKSIWTVIPYLVTETRVPGQYFYIRLQTQECLENSFGYRGKNMWPILLYLVTEARMSGQYFSCKRDKSAWTIYLVTEARISGQYFSVW